MSWGIVLGMLPWLDIFKHDATYVAKEITEWIEIGIDCYIPRRKFQLKPHSPPWSIPSCAAAIAHRNHYFHQYHRNATPENRKLFCDSRNHCKNVLKDARSNYAEGTRRSVASQLIGSGDFWRICNRVLNRRGSLPYLLSLMAQTSWQYLLTKLNLFARNVSCISTLDDGSQQLPDFPSRTKQRVSSKNITAKIGFSCNLRSWCIQSHWPRPNFSHCL